MSAWASAGAGAADGLETLLARHIVEDRLAEESRHNRAQEDYQSRALNQNDQLRRDTLAQNARDKHDAGVEKTVAMRAPGDAVSEAEFSDETQSGIPTGLYSIKPPKAPTSSVGYATMPGDLHPAGAMTTPQADPTSPLTAPRSITFNGTGTARAAATKETDLEGARLAGIQQKIDAATERATQAWERLRQQGETASAVESFHESQSELRQLQLELERSKADAAAAKTNAPIFMRDAKGQDHAMLFDKGTMREIPLPEGYQPTKAAAPGIFDRISSLFSGSDAQPGADPTDPHWGRPQ